MISFAAFDNSISSATDGWLYSSIIFEVPTKYYNFYGILVHFTFMRSSIKLTTTRSAAVTVIEY